MGLRLQLLLRFNLPLLILSSVVMGIHYLFINDYRDFIETHFSDYRSHLKDFYDLQNDMFVEICHGYLSTAYNSVNLSAELLHKAYHEEGVVKPYFRGTERAYNYYKAPALFNATHSVWNLDPCINSYKELQDYPDASNSLKYSGIIETVIRPYLRANERYYNFISEFEIGYESSLSYMSGYNRTESKQCVCKEYVRGRCSNPFDFTKEDWYNDIKQVQDNQAHLLNPYISIIMEGDDILQRVCRELHTNQFLGVICIGLYSNKLLSRQYYGILKELKLLYSDSYIINPEKYISFYPHFNHSFYDKKHLSDIEFPNTNDSRKIELKHRMDRALDSMIYGNTSHTEFYYTANDDSEKVATLSLIPETNKVIFLNTVRNVLKDVQADHTEYEIYAAIQFIASVYTGLMVLLLVGLAYINLSMYEMVIASLRDYAEQLEDIKTGVRDGFTRKAIWSCKEIGGLDRLFEKIVIIYLLQDTKNFNNEQKAIRIYIEAFRVFKNSRNKTGMYACGYHLGLIYMQLSEYKSAALVFEKCLELFKSGELQDDSKGRLISCISLAYYLSGQVDKMNQLFRSFENTLTGNDLKVQLLCECDFLECEGFPLRDLIELLSLFIDKENDSIILQRYYYYKAMMYKQESNTRKQFKFLNKALYSGRLFDPKLRVLILGEIREIMIMYEWEVKSVDAYLGSLHDLPVNIEIILALKKDKKEFYFNMMEIIEEYTRKVDRISINLCKGDNIINAVPSKSREIEMFDDATECVLYDSLAHTISQLKQKVRHRPANSWILILTDKSERGSMTRLNELITFNLLCQINYVLLSDLSSSGLEKFLERSFRYYRADGLSISDLPLAIQYIFSMRYPASTFISERFLYSSHLI
jgi:hypothetical protein